MEQFWIKNADSQALSDISSPRISAIYATLRWSLLAAPRTLHFAFFAVDWSWLGLRHTMIFVLFEFFVVE